MHMAVVERLGPNNYKRGKRIIGPKGYRPGLKAFIPVDVARKIPGQKIYQHKLRYFRRLKSKNLQINPAGAASIPKEKYRAEQNGRYNQSYYNQRLFIKITIIKRDI